MALVGFTLMPLHPTHLTLATLHGRIADRNGHDNLKSRPGSNYLFGWIHRHKADGPTLQ